MATKFDPTTATDAEKLAWANEQFGKKAGRKAKGQAKRQATKALIEKYAKEYKNLLDLAVAGKLGKSAK